jgi:triphosphatase
MHEIELKFQVAQTARRLVEKAVASAAARRTRLLAIYYDTEDRALASVGIALRLRKEGRRWVQTSKARGANTLQRLEHNVDVAVRAGTAPAIDVQRHAGTPAGEALFAALAAREDRTPPLQELFRTDIWRTHRVTRAPGASVELAFDAGRICAGAQVLPVCELEIELQHGTPLALVEAARRWAKHQGVWLDVRTKAERGDRLARGIGVGEARRAGLSPWQPHMNVGEALHSGVHECLAHILSNTSEIAGGSYAQDHVHQARVGMRRLRALLRFAGDAVPESAQAWDRAMSALAARLGTARDRDVLTGSLLPALKAAGAPTIELPATASIDDPVDALRSPETNLLLLELLAFANDDATPTAGAAASGEAPSIKSHAKRQLRRWHRRIVDQHKAFAELDDEARHTLRKRAKRLRYAAEFCAVLYPAKAVERYLAPLKALQERLGEFNDLRMAKLAYEAAMPSDARAWFALGWIAARREVVLAEAADALREFARVKPFWGKR